MKAVRPNPTIQKKNAREEIKHVLWKHWIWGHILRPFGGFLLRLISKIQHKWAETEQREQETSK